MYEIVDFSVSEIVLVYIVMLSASIVAFPLIMLIYTAVEKGASKWR